MSFNPLQTTSVKNGGKQSHPGKKENKKRKPWNIVSLRVPGTFVQEQPNPVPGLIRICQETSKKKTSRRKLCHLSYVAVPEITEPPEDFSFETSCLDCIPSIKRCTVQEIQAVNNRYKKIRKKRKNSANIRQHDVTNESPRKVVTPLTDDPTEFNSNLTSSRTPPCT